MCGSLFEHPFNCPSVRANTHPQKTLQTLVVKVTEATIKKRRTTEAVGVSFRLPFMSSAPAGIRFYEHGVSSEQICQRLWK